MYHKDRFKKKCKINSRQNDRTIFSAPRALHALTVTECCVNDVRATNQVMTDKYHTTKQGGARVHDALTLYRYRAGGRGGEKEREECGARIADKMSDSRKRSSMSNYGILEIIGFIIIILNNLSDICAHILITGQNSA